MRVNNFGWQFIISLLSNIAEYWVWKTNSILTRNVTFPISLRIDICITPHQRKSVEQGRFLGGSGRRAEAHTRPAVPKMAGAPSAFPFSGRLMRRVINPTPPKSVKSWWDGAMRPEVLHPVVERTQTNCAARNHSRSRAPHYWKQFNATFKKEKACRIYPTPHQRKNVAQSLSKVGPVAGPEPTRVRQFQKCLEPRRYSPFWGASGAGR